MEWIKVQGNIDRISELVKSNKLIGQNGAYESFKSYLKNVKKIDLEEIRKFGKLFKDIDASEFIKIIDESNKVNKEILVLVRAVLVVNFYEYDHDYINTYFKKIINEYPSSSNLRYIYSKYLLDKGFYRKSLNYCLILLKIEPNNPEFINLCFNVEKKCFDNLLKKGKIIEAEKYLNEIAENKLYKDYNNNLVPMDNRLEDHKIIKQKIDKIDKIIEEKTEKERNKIIEMLGIFTGVLGFIFSSINIALNNLRIQEVMWLMLEMAVIFLVFAISISFVFQKDKKEFYRETKFWILLFLILIIILGIFFVSWKGILFVIF